MLQFVLMSCSMFSVCFYRAHVCVRVHLRVMYSLAVCCRVLQCVAVWFRRSGHALWWCHRSEYLTPQRARARAMRCQITCEWAWVWTYINIYAHIYIYIHICIYVYVCVYICIYLWMYCHICIYIHTYVYMNMSVYIYVYVCIYLYTYICICICMYISIYLNICSESRHIWMSHITHVNESRHTYKWVVPHIW